jgi:hypothetical protein
MRVFRYGSLLLLLLAACHGSNSPTDPSSQPHGRLTGLVTIGPNCPVEQVNNPCPTPPAAYQLRKILVYDAGRSRLLATVDIDTQGLYLIDLLPATYLIDLHGSGIDRTSSLPQPVVIHANTVTRLDVSVDTGIR